MSLTTIHNIRALKHQQRNLKKSRWFSLFSFLWPKNGARFDSGRWMTRDISMNAKARNVSDVAGVAWRSKNRIRSRERTNEATVPRRSGNVGATRIGSRVRSIVNHGGRTERNSHWKSCQFSIVCTRFSRRSCIAGTVVVAIVGISPLPSPPQPVYCIGALLVRTHFRVVAIYKSSAFPLTSHYGTWNRDTCARP